MSIPNAALTQHIAILGKTGSGKTCTAKLAVEQVVSDGARVCVLDPIKSDWWGLALAANGIDRGLPFQILGGPRGHVALHSAAGKAVAEVVASGALPHSIIDMADFAPGGQSHFFTDFAPVLLRKMRGVLYLVIEEAHLFAPKERSGIGQENMAIHWAKTLAQAGRSKGIRLVVLTQRTQALHNAMLGSCDTLIAHRLTSPADQDPVIKWLKANAAKEVTDKVAASISSQKKGQGWLCSGEAQLFEQRKFPLMKTYDNTATPTDDEHREVTVPPVDVDALKTLIGQAAADAEANDPKRLKEELTKLRTELNKRQAIPPITIPSGEKPMSAAVEQKLDRLLDFFQRGQSAQSAVNAAGAGPKPAATVAASNGHIDEESLYQRFKTRLLSEVSLGGVQVTVTPPERLRKQFQVEEASRIVDAVRQLDPLGKRVVKLLEGLEGAYLTQKQIAERLGRGTSGGAAQTLSTQVKQLAAAGIVSLDSKRGVTRSLRSRIAADLSTYQPSDDEVEQVYQTALHEIATGAAD